MTADEHGASADRQALLELLLAEEGIDFRPSSIGPRAPDEDLVLSHAQERMWFLDQFEDDTSSFNVRAAVRLRGPLDVSVLRRALDDIVQRHDILRTLILSDGGKPRPSVLESAGMPMSIVDVDGDEKRVDAVLAEETSRRFALDRELPIHVCVMRIADGDHVLSVVIHHIASDGWSLRVFFNELGQLYVAHLRGEPSPLSELPVQYLDYATWQRRDGGDADRHQLEYWREQLAGPLPIFEIPPDFSRPARHTFEGAQVEELLPLDLTRALRDLGTRANATMFMTLLAAFSVVTSRHAGETDVLIGTPVAGRRRPELEPMMGMFLNTLALRNQLGDNPTFRELLARVRDTSLSAFDNQEVPFERLLAELHPVRDLSRTPLFQIFFNVLNLDVEQASFELPDVQVEVIENHDLGSKFDLTVYVAERENGTTLLFVYNRALYTAQTMEHLAGQFVHVLRQVVADPDRPIFDYSLVTRPAEPKIPDAGAPLDATWYGSVPDSVRRVARDQPSRAAVADGAHCWTYGMLANQMSRLGNWLRLAHVGKGDVVAIYAHRSASLVWAVVGALASGAAYVLLDPRYPPNRLAQYLRIAKPKAWLALEAAGEVPEEVLRALDDVGVATRLSLPDLAHIDCLDAILGGACDTNHASLPEIGPDDPASLTFTSGSTGVPKAVIGRHGSLTHFFPWMSHEFQVTSDDRFSMLSGLAHDPIQRDMFWPLSVGATLFVPDPEQLATSGWLAEWMRDNAITVAHLTPAMGKLVIEAGPSSPGSPPRSNATIPSLRLALFMGDVLTRGDVAQLRAVAPDVKALNLYGSTETQRASAYHVADLETTDDGNHRYREILPLGTGMPDVQLLLRTPTGATAGVGEIADIYFRSPHLALGYFGDDQLTSDRFTRNPVSDDPADRLYRTGDRGRYRPDGSVEFCGRADQQIKVRGFRIELGEIQATLARHQNVRDAVVVPADADSPDGGLVAYVVLEGRPQPDTIELARFLRAELPAHMVPADIVAIDRIPLTPNGKLDRAALIDPRAHRRPWTAGGAPRDSVERMLVELWEDVLDRDPVMIDDDFFALGGYSLLATRLFALIEERTGKRLPVSILFENPTVAGLADVIRDDGWKPEWSSMVPIQPEGNKPPLFYVAPYVISVLQLAQLGEVLGRDQPLYGFQPQGLDGRLPPHERIEDMAKHYIAELKSVQPSGPYSIGGHCSGAWVAFEMACQLEASGDAVHAVVMVDQGPPGVERPHVRPMPYLINRVRFYFRDGRLRHSAAWQFKILTARFLLRRVGPPTARYEEHTREVNRRAFRNYRGGQIKHDITLVRSAESLALDDKTWFVRWAERTEGEVTVVDVGGTHANLLVRPFVVDLAAKIERAISDECPHTATVAQPQPITNPERPR